MEDRMFWIDLETEGLNQVTDHLLEVGAVITDLQLNVIAERSWLVHPYRMWRPESLSVKNNFVYEMHKASGLLDAIMTGGVSAYVVDQELQAWCRSFGLGIDNTDPVCGSSVHFDRDFMKSQLPETNSGFSYRNIDVSSEKEEIRRYRPEWFAEWKDIIGSLPKAHRAIADVKQSIAEFGFYRAKRGDI